MSIEQQEQRDLRKFQLNNQIKDLTIQLEEVKNTIQLEEKDKKPKVVYQKKSNIYFLQTSKDQVVSNLKQEIIDKNKEYENISLPSTTTQTTNKKATATTTTTTKKNTTTTTVPGNKFKPNIPVNKKK